MKPLLTSTALFLLVIGFSGVVSGQDTLVDFEETKRLAERGFAASQTLLGVMYYLGEGVPENKAEAARWYRLAAEQGDVNAQYELGTMYLNGEGVPENDAEAARWWLLAAKQGHANGQYNLGVMYFDGEGVPQNNVRAYMWWSVAAAQGNESARTNRDITFERLTPDQLARGQDMATRCFESDYQDCE
jgi:TPR repeat protein